MAYNVYKEMHKVTESVAAILQAEDAISEITATDAERQEAFDWALGRAAELEALNPHLREEDCYLWALGEARVAVEARGWDFDPDYQI